MAIPCCFICCITGEGGSGLILSSALLSWLWKSLGCPQAQIQHCCAWLDTPASLGDSDTLGPCVGQSPPLPGAISGDEEKLPRLRIPGCLLCSFCLCAVVGFQQVCLESVPCLRCSSPANQPHSFLTDPISSSSPLWLPKQILSSLHVYSFQVFQLLHRSSAVLSLP